MASGTPVVASDIEGYRQVIRSGENGVLSPPGDPQAISERLLRLLTDQGSRRRLGRRAQQHAPRYSWKTMADRILEQYEKAAWRSGRRLSLSPPADP